MSSKVNVYNGGDAVELKDSAALYTIPKGESVQPETVGQRAAVKCGPRGVVLLNDDPKIAKHQKAIADVKASEWALQEAARTRGEKVDGGPDSRTIEAGFRAQVRVREAQKAARQAAAEAADLEERAKDVMKANPEATKAVAEATK